MNGNVCVIQYADDITFLASFQNARITRNKIQAALCGIQSYLFSKDLNVAPAKSQMMILEKCRKVSAIPPMPLHGEIVPIAEKVRYLGIMLDRTLSGREHLRFLC